jgi:hypothetical protein
MINLPHKAIAYVSTLCYIVPVRSYLEMSLFWVKHFLSIKITSN